MYEEITDENPYETPMMIYPALHYSMGGLWVDYELQTSIPAYLQSERQTSRIMGLTVWELLL